MALVREAGEVPLRLGEDAMISLRIDPAPNIEAPIVFAGYGLSIPEASHNDFNDLDANGKIVVYLPGLIANHLAIGRGKIVANITIYIIGHCYTIKKTTMFGNDESDLGDDAAAVATASGVLPRPDPFP